MTGAGRFDQLPREIIEDVWLRLDTESSRNAAASSRLVHAIARRHLWRTVRIAVADDDIHQLQPKALQLREQISKVGFSNVRRVDIIVEQAFRAVNSRHAVMQNQSEVLDAHESWQKLAQLILALPKLEAVSISDANAVSHELLSAVETHVRKPRFHIQNFELCDLDLKDLSPDTIELRLRLLRSSCLDSVKFTSSWMYKLMEYENDLLDLLGSLNPCIKQFSIVTCGESPRGTRKKMIYMYPPTIFKDLPKKARRHRAPAALEYFSFGGHKTGRELERFAKRADFTMLRELHLERLVLPDAISSLLHSNVRFPALLTLSLGTAANNPQIDSQTATFIRTISPLRTLRMTMGTGKLALEAILETHCESLRSLSLGSSESGYISDYTDVASPQTVRLIAERCPNISYLDIMTPHFAGEEQELEMLTALGSMPRLQDLMLSLAFEHYKADGPVRGEYIQREDLQALERITTHISTGIQAESAIGKDKPREQFCRGGIVTKTLIACALDDALACQIFRHVDQSKPKYNPRSLRLESLVVRTVGGRYCIDLNHCLDWIGRPRRVQRCIRDDSREKLETCVSYTNKGWGTYHDVAVGLYPPLEEIFDNIWLGEADWTERDICGLLMMSKDGTRAPS